jgi:hypothetical protein
MAGLRGVEVQMAELEVTLVSARALLLGLATAVGEALHKMETREAEAEAVDPV